MSIYIPQSLDQIVRDILENIEDFSEGSEIASIHLVDGQVHVVQYPHMPRQGDASGYPFLVANKELQKMTKDQLTSLLAPYFNQP